MEKEKIKDKFLSFFNNKNFLKVFNFNENGIVNFLLLLFFLLDLLFSNFSILFQLIILFFLSNKTNDNKRNLLLSLYLIIPIFSHIYFLNKFNSFDLVLWIYLLLFSIKITIFLFNNTFDDITNKYHIFTLLGIIIVSILIGIISALFLKQKLVYFILINMLLSFSIYIQNIFKKKITYFFLKDSSKFNKILNDVHYNFLIIFFILILFFK